MTSIARLAGSAEMPIRLFGKNIRLYTTKELVQIAKAQAKGIQEMLREQDIIADEITRRINEGED